MTDDRLLAEVRGFLAAFQAAGVVDGGAVDALIERIDAHLAERERLGA